MSKIIIREAVIEDYIAINAINKDSLGYDFDLEATRNNLQCILSSSFDKVFVAEFEGTVVGYVHSSNYASTYSKPLKNILAIAVSTNIQKQGVGKQLILAIEQWAKEDGCFGVRLVSGLNRKQAHDFYKHCGYKERKRQINFIKWFS